ncbi:hypothetical protein M5U04_07075 [Xenorhabdus sp. XENO-1]|uniref:hypothetical protein n=1 Tax=Xenorhabdus bovienii TaxID=40576 RepID=UPI0020CA9A6E|nr:hypothetical protein [Xenorhabdus bovienii]MCP9267867.1 hypothetical protein [Xenorhabdus bovienii subsp. africana]
MISAISKMGYYTLKTILQEFYQVTFRKKIYTSIEDLQAELNLTDAAEKLITVDETLTIAINV